MMIVIFNKKVYQIALIFLAGFVSTSSLLAEGRVTVRTSEAKIPYSVKCKSTVGTKLVFEGSFTRDFVFNHPRPIKSCQVEHKGKKGIIKVIYQQMVRQATSRTHYSSSSTITNRQPGSTKKVVFNWQYEEGAGRLNEFDR